MPKSAWSRFVDTTLLDPSVGLVIVAAICHGILWAVRTKVGFSIPLLEDGLGLVETLGILNICVRFLIRSVDDAIRAFVRWRRLLRRP